MSLISGNMLSNQIHASLAIATGSLARTSAKQLSHVSDTLDARRDWVFSVKYKISGHDLSTACYRVGRFGRGSVLANASE